MSSSAPLNSTGFNIVENVTFSRDFGQFLFQITDLYQKIAVSSNAKDVGTYEPIELLNGQQYFGSTQQTKNSIYRKVIECGALPNAGNKQVAHGIAGINNTWMFTRIYGIARNPTTTQFIPLPDSGAYQVSLMVDATNINIATVANLSAFSYSIIVLEYWKLN